MKRTAHRPRRNADGTFGCTGCKVRVADGDLIAAHCQVAGETGELLLTGEAAALAGVQTKTWTSYVARGQAPGPVDRIGRTPRYSRTAVLAMVNGRTR